MPILLVAADLTIDGLVVGTLVLLVRGRPVPPDGFAILRRDAAGLYEHLAGHGVRIVKVCGTRTTACAVSSAATPTATASTSGS